MKKLEHKLLPCIFCTIGLNSYIVGHNLVYTAMSKLTKDVLSSKVKERSTTTNTATVTVAENNYTALNLNIK